MSGSRTVRAPAALLALALLAAAGCSPAPPPPPPETPSLLRLWQDNGPNFPVTALATDRVAAPPAKASATPAPAPAPATLLDCDFRDRTEWYEVVQDSEVPDQFVYRRITPESGALEVQRRECWAVIKSIAVRGGEPLTVRVNAEITGASALAAAGDPVPVLTVVELREPFDGAGKLSGQAASELLDPHRHETHEAEARPGAAPQDVTLRFVTSPLTVEVLLCLLVPPAKAGALVAHHLAVTRGPLVDYMETGGDFPRMRSLHGPAGPLGDGAVSLTFDRDERVGLLALPGHGYRFDVGRSASARRLDLSLGVAPRDGNIEGAVAVRIEADGVLLHEARLVAPRDASEAAWRDVSLVLPPTPDSALALTLTAAGEGSDPPLAIFGHPEVRTRGATRRPNVVLISIDTLRADRLGCYGGDKAISTHIDALAAEGLRFSQASSTSSYTLPSHGSMLTGQYPAVHGAVDIVDRLDPVRSPFLAKILADDGYVTAAFTAGGYVAPEYGFSYGFDRYATNDPVWPMDSLRGRQLLQTVSFQSGPAQLPLQRRYAAPVIYQWLARQDDGVPFFVFLHTYICHNFAPNHDWLVRRNLTDDLGRESPFNHQDREAFNKGDPVAREKVVSEYLAYYDATIGMADEFVGGVVDALDRAGLLENTLIVVTSDHGEEFGEHGYFGHGDTLFEPATHVPMIVRLPRSVLALQAASAPRGAAPGAAGSGAPGGTAGEPPLHQPAVITGPISLMDLAPWILRLVGLTPDPRMSDCSKKWLDQVSPPKRSVLFMELDTPNDRVSAVREGRLKLHTQLGGASHGLTTGKSLLFDLGPDRGETKDLAAERPEDVKHLRDLLDAFHACAQAEHVRTERSGSDFGDLPADVIADLKGLGYLGGGGAETVPAKAADPKEPSQSDSKSTPSKAPTISDIANQGTSIGTPTAAIPFTVGDPDTAVGSLTVSGGSNNTTLLPAANIVFAGSGASRTVTVTPTPGQAGSATITVTVGDGALSTSDSFVLTVSAAKSQ